MSVCVDSHRFLLLRCPRPSFHTVVREKKKGLSQLICKSFSLHLASCEESFLLVECRGCPRCAAKLRKSRMMFGYLSLTASVQSRLGHCTSEQHYISL